MLPRSSVSFLFSHDSLTIVESSVEGSGVYSIGDHKHWRVPHWRSQALACTALAITSLEAYRIGDRKQTLPQLSASKDSSSEFPFQRNESAVLPGVYRIGDHKQTLLPVGYALARPQPSHYMVGGAWALHKRSWLARMNQLATLLVARRSPVPPAPSARRAARARTLLWALLHPPLGARRAFAHCEGPCTRGGLSDRTARGLPPLITRPGRSQTSARGRSSPALRYPRLTRATLGPPAQPPAHPRNPPGRCEARPRPVHHPSVAPPWPAEGPRGTVALGVPAPRCTPAQPARARKATPALLCPPILRMEPPASVPPAASGPIATSARTAQSNTRISVGSVSGEVARPTRAILAHPTRPHRAFLMRPALLPSPRRGSRKGAAGL